ncbi:sufE protein [Bellilinea caldifistulae]|uniref:Cysteine desufuration protein SufE n=1 Tax=Bellilinea caldifistulae TaxID=360411 RepID=A0A0P6WZA1_9CHLR|nr:SufE family protein [Bellilinea caldifistulae]KPL75336.1 cysteine desufuration protein SufE [Bellilinea caldifistulae]GAP09755.1 sufE protein [Bellilinea caldifistulae]
MNVNLPPRLAEIVSDFAECEGREKLELLLDYARRFPPLPAEFNADSDAEDVPECMTPVRMSAKLTNGRLTFAFDVPAESPTVRGYAMIIMEGLNETTPEEILAIPAEFYLQMGLQDVLTAQRLNGMAAILAHVKRRAAEALEKTD